MVNISLINRIINTINYYYHSKKSLLIFLLILIGVLIPSFSGNVGLNVWHRFYNIVTSKIFNVLLSFAMLYNIFIIVNEKTNYNLLIRLKNKRNIIKKYIVDIVICTLYLCIISLIVTMAGAIVFSRGDFKIIAHNEYNISILLYIIAQYIKLILFHTILNITIYLICCRYKKSIIKIFGIINSLIYFVIDVEIINLGYYVIMIFPQILLINPIFSSFGFEIIFSVIEFVLLIMLLMFLYNKNINERGDYL